MNVYLPPGGIHASVAPCRIATLVGTCVAVTLWSPRRRVGGMNHFRLPEAGHPAMASLLARVEVLAGDDDLEAKIFGGASRLGEHNVTAAWGFVRAHGLRVVGERVGGRAARKISLDVETGTVSVTTVGGGDDPATAH